MLNLTREECQALIRLLNSLPGYAFLYGGKSLEVSCDKLTRHLESYEDYKTDETT